MNSALAGEGLRLLDHFHTWCIGWSAASAVQLGFGNETALATEVTETLPQALKRDPRIDGSYARLKACSTHRLYTRCETAIDHLLPGLKSVCENVCRPYGTRIYFPLYPALRLRLRAGLDYSAPTALDFPLGDSTRKCQVWFSHTLLSPFLLHLLTAQLKLRPFKTRRSTLLLSAGPGGLLFR